MISFVFWCYVLILQRPERKFKFASAGVAVLYSDFQNRKVRGGQKQGGFFHARFSLEKGKITENVADNPFLR